jgi:hypothetical protein
VVLELDVFFESIVGVFGVALRILSSCLPKIHAILLRTNEASVIGAAVAPLLIIPPLVPLPNPNLIPVHILRGILLKIESAKVLLLCGCGDVPTALFLRISISHK